MADPAPVLLRPEVIFERPPERSRIAPNYVEALQRFSVAERPQVDGLKTDPFNEARHQGLRLRVIPNYG